MIIIKTENTENTDFEDLALIFKINKNNKIQIDVKGNHFYFDLKMILTLENAKDLIKELQNMINELEN